jgi:hypothetical protein
MVVQHSYISSKLICYCFAQYANDENSTLILQRRSWALNETDINQGHNITESQ